MLVQVLGEERRSVRVDTLIRRLESPIFDDARGKPRLWSMVCSRMDSYPDPQADLARGQRPKKKYPTTAEALLVECNHQSFLFAVTKPTTYKIVDWGRDLQLIGRGNQITERGLILRAASEGSGPEKFLDGDVSAWNPFILTRKEQMLFLYHLTELDEVTLQVADKLGTLKVGEALELVDAGKIVFHSLEKVLTRAANNIRPADIPAFRTAVELAETIGEELGIESNLPAHERRAVPKPLKPSARRKALLESASAVTPRKTHKNADHQTVPRFEQLVDLDLLAKDSKDNDLPARRRWTWRPTEVAKRWAEARASMAALSRFHWQGFARAAVAAYSGSEGVYAGDDTVCVARYLLRGYRSVRRPVGHTPLDSAALMAMAEAASEGVAIELQDFHALMMALKKRALLQDEVFFASGNDLDKMFIMIRDDFADRVSQVLPAVLRAEQI